MDFRDWAVQLVPPWLRQPKGEAFVRGLGEGKDWLAHRLRQSVLSRFFSYATADALNYGAAERQLLRAPTDTDAQFAARLRGAWNVWPWAGTPFGVLSELKASGYASVMLLVVLGKRYTLDGAGALVTASAPDGTYLMGPSNIWNQFRAVVTALPAQWGGVVLGNSSDEANRMRGILGRWKPAHAILDAIVIPNGGNVYGLPGTPAWGAAGLTWGNSTTVVWTP